MTETSIRTDAGVKRCSWCGTDPLYVTYHDEEWGTPVTDDVRLFEKVCLEGFQAGLSWLTILKKREAFRRGFAGFDFRKVARFGDEQVEELLQDASIVRHRGKIESTIHNARRALEMIEQEGSLATFFWSFEEKRRAFPGWVAKTDASTRLSKELRRRGWKFVGPTTMYALMQAMGVVNDHAPGCHVRERVTEQRRALARP